MIHFSGILIGHVILATCLVTLSTLIVLLFFRMATNASNQTRILAWSLVLLQGWMLFVIPIEIPWLQAEAQPASNFGVVIEDVGLVPNVAEFSANSKVDSSTNLSGLMLLALIWCAGSLFALLQPFRHYQRLIRIVGQLPDADAEARFELERLQDRLQSQENVQLNCRLVFSNEIGPFVCRALQGHVIVVPETLWRSLERPQREAILKHELTHVARLDLWKITAARFLVSAQWFNPLAWLALRKLVESIELACDQTAKGETAQQRLEYSRALLALAEWNSPEQQRGPMLLANAQGKPLIQRVENVLTPKGNEMKLTRMFVCTLLIAIMLAGVLRVKLVAQEKDEKPAFNNAIAEKADKAAGELYFTETHMVADLIVGSFMMGDTEPDRRITEMDFVELMKLIQETIDPDSWEGHGGRGRLQPFPGDLSLIVTQKQENLDRIQNLLVRLREFNAITIALDAELLVMSPEDLAISRVKLSDGLGTIVDGKDARILAAFAKSKENSKRFALPTANVFNGEIFRFNVPENKDGNKSLGGVDFSDIRVRGSIWNTQEIVRLSVLGKRIGTKETPLRDSITNYEGKWTENVAEGGFIVVDVSENLIDKESKKRGLLVMHVEIHRWK